MRCKKAMVFAAGLGTRLRPLTNDRPKALVEVSGRTMLEIALERLRGVGVTEAIVNTHHYAEKISQYLVANRNFGMRIEISHEEELLDTGGGLKKAAWFFLEGDTAAPFFLHNVDVVSTIDLAAMAEFHGAQDALVTLAVQERKTSRYLLFNEQGLLCGRRKGKEDEVNVASSHPSKAWMGHTAEIISSHPSDKSENVARVGHPQTAEGAQALGFCGIHVISPLIFGLMTETGAFSIIDAYLRLAAQGERIAAFRADGAKWRDLGTPESVREAESRS